MLQKQRKLTAARDSIAKFLVLPDKLLGKKSAVIVNHTRADSVKMARLRRVDMKFAVKYLAVECSGDCSVAYRSKVLQNGDRALAVGSVRGDCEE